MLFSVVPKEVPSEVFGGPRGFARRFKAFRTVSFTASSEDSRKFLGSSKGLPEAEMSLRASGEF